MRCGYRHTAETGVGRAGGGATSPAPLAGAIALQTAEVVSGLVYLNLLNPGHHALFGALPFVSDLRTGAMSGGSAEQGLLMAGCAQMAQYYGIPCAVSAGMTDSKLPDFQAGYEKGCTELLSALAGANLIYEAAGMYGSLLACSSESFVLDNDLIGGGSSSHQGYRSYRRDIVTQGDSGYLLERSRALPGAQSNTGPDAKRLLLPRSLADRNTPQEWRQNGAPDILEIARRENPRNSGTTGTGSH